MKRSILVPLAVVICLSAQQSQVGGFAQQFVQLLVSGNFAAAEQSFDSTMKSKLPEEKLRETWNTLVSQVGAFKRQVGVKTQKLQGYDVANVKCEFESASLTVRVVLNSSKQVAGLFFLPAETAEYKAPDYAHPASFQEKEVLFGTKDWMLHGTMTIPAGTGPFAGVVLVHGSGPNDRDESIGPNKPFRDLAWGLASRRIAVFRYDKRTLEHSAKFAGMNDITVREETIDDALAAVQTLRTGERMDASRIFVLGHSLGGMLAPWIGKGDPQIAGLVIMAGTTRPLEDILVDQYTYLASLGGASKADLAKVQEQAARVKDPQLSKATPASSLPLGVSAPYWLALRNYNPAETARTLSGPMLILQGERDYQATMRDFDGWKTALGSRKNVTFKSYPNLNHLFMEGKGKATPEEYSKAGHVSRAVVEDIAGWIGERKR